MRESRRSGSLRTNAENDHGTGHDENQSDKSYSLASSPVYSRQVQRGNETALALMKLAVAEINRRVAEQKGRGMSVFTDYWPDHGDVFLDTQGRQWRIVGEDPDNTGVPFVRQRKLTSHLLAERDNWTEHKFFNANTGVSEDGTVTLVSLHERGQK